MIVATLSDWEAIGVIGVSALTIIGLIFRGVVRPILQLIERVDGIAIKVDAVEKQMQPNAGSTFRDAIDRIEVQNAQLDERLARVEGNQ